ncbi:hypothetical protein CH253_08320 [Rhodococcus sp. 06-156-3C]|uniref:RNA ligase family protein n=1 Tax=Rhodococcus sp. 06-156-3C TaxID=2022486 RepID=UPI000B9B1D64|nr:RNA ligase family protein [Rhodococcus sp. 06-156-3C]OZD23851.1 hypothetical protein CH253_08320 [Rhodococcus sp. 06-156-3C]
MLGTIDFEFKGWPKTPRLKRSMCITEKIDGTNACVFVSEDGKLVGAQSRNRIIEPGNDNAGFAKWVYENAGVLADVLGPGYHYGEWWGSGIQRAYGLTHGEKRFSLFNADRWQSHAEELEAVDGLSVVPVLLRADFDTQAIADVTEALEEGGSIAAPGFMRPEGVIVYLPAARQGFKVLLENDHLPKGAA